MTLAFFDDEPGGRTRIKLCGFTREADVDAAVALGVDALGFVFYPHSPRYVTPARAAALVARVPAAIATVGLLVDPSRADIHALLERVPLSALQFHGDEDPAVYAGLPLPRVKAARVQPGLDLLDFARRHAHADLLMLDAHSAGYGGSGHAFDWSLVPVGLIGDNARPRVVLSGGLNATNVVDAMQRIRPFAVDTSSGIESAKGIKDPAAMRSFVDAVRSGDRTLR